MPDYSSANSSSNYCSGYRPKSQLFLVAEVAHAGEDHGQAQAVGGFDDFLVALRASGLDDGGGAGFGDFFDAVGKGKEGVGGGDGAFQRQ